MHIPPTSCLLALLRLHGHWEIMFGKPELTNIIDALFWAAHAEESLEYWHMQACTHAAWTVL